MCSWCKVDAAHVIARTQCQSVSSRQSKCSASHKATLTKTQHTDLGPARVPSCHVSGSRTGFPRGTHEILSAGPTRAPCAGTRRVTRRLPAGYPTRVPARNQARSDMGPYKASIQCDGCDTLCCPSPQS